MSVDTKRVEAEGDKLPTTGKISFKPYTCSGCGAEKEIDTNHWGSCYPWCSVCQKPTVWKCGEEPPEGFGVPEEWRIMKLGDVVDIEPANG